MIDQLHNQCLALQAIAILTCGTEGDRTRALRIYDRAARHVLPILLDDTPLGYLPKVMIDEDLIDEDATLVDTRRKQPSRVRTLLGFCAQWRITT